MHSSNLDSLMYFLTAAVFAVPLFQRFKMGAILGYLVAGILIGPQIFNLVQDPKSILQFAEIGVIFLLFIIGLELHPQKLWKMRRHILLLGGGQLLITALIFSSIIYLLTSEVNSALIIGLALALSSTAFSIQIMADKGLLGSNIGRRAFSILLMQDIAVIPILLMVQSFSQMSVLDTPPWWLGLLAILLLLAAGRFLLDSLLKKVAQYGNRESMTATALLIVVGAAYIMNKAGLSMGLGAFIAGVMLANSNFRHQLETDIEPFKGLTLGLFFIAIGMSMDLRLFMQSPLLLIGLALLLVTIKTFIISFLLQLQKIGSYKRIQIGLILSQGGEFAFVIMAQSTALKILNDEITSQVNLVVGLSMMLTTPLISVFEKLFKKEEQPIIDHKTFIQNKTAEVMILGFGRFGQITGRILSANKIKFTAIDQDAEHISFLMKFGNKVHFGDATRMDLLKAAGISRVKTVVIAIDDNKQTLKLVKIIRQKYSHIHIIARAHNRSHHLELIAAGSDKVIREIMDASLQAASETLISIGYTTSQALQTVDVFRSHDEKMMNDSLEHRDNLNELINIGAKGRKELEDIFGQDKSVK